MQKVICKKCEYKFNPTKLRVRKLKSDINELYLKCPKCKDETRVALTNKEIRKLQKQLNKYKEIYGRDTNNKEVATKINLVSKELKQKLDRLNSKA